MTSEQFIEALRRVVLESAVDSTIVVLERPPGRRPERAAVETSTWYKGLSDQDRIMLKRALAMTAHHAVFGFLAVLDGVRVVEDDPEKGRFRLLFQKGTTELELNPVDGVPLHDILNQRKTDEP